MGSRWLGFSVELREFGMEYSKPSLMTSAKKFLIAETLLNILCFIRKRNFVFHSEYGMMRGFRWGVNFSLVRFWNSLEKCSEPMRHFFCCEFCIMEMGVCLCRKAFVGLSQQMNVVDELS